MRTSFNVDKLNPYALSFGITSSWLKHSNGLKRTAHKAPTALPLSVARIHFSDKPKGILVNYSLSGSHVVTLCNHNLKIIWQCRRNTDNSSSHLILFYPFYVKVPQLLILSRMEKKRKIEGIVNILTLKVNKYIHFIFDNFNRNI